jgi:hypothetical protein
LDNSTINKLRSIAWEERRYSPKRRTLLNAATSPTNLENNNLAPPFASYEEKFQEKSFAGNSSKVENVNLTQRNILETLHKENESNLRGNCNYHN